MLFNEMNLKANTLKAVEALGFESATEIQEKSIPLLLEDNIDFIGQAQTGTGKTAAFTLPLLEKIDFKSNKIQSIVLAPTRELANQICEEVKKLSKFEPVKTLSIYGGTSVSGQLRELKKIKPQILVGTPGRTLDFLRRGALDLRAVKFVILDEADEMLDMGFFDDVNEIVSSVEDKNTWMFSATMPKPILNMINKEFNDPQIVRVTKKILTNDQVAQQFCLVRSRNHSEALCRYLDFYQNSYAIVFTRTKIMAKELTDTLNERGYMADSLHGDMSQDQRDITMKKFKNKKVHLLVCTDVAARGIDVDNLTHVVNYGLPQDNEAYVHRIGRTGRGGSKGIALSIIDPSEQRRLRDIERITKAKIEKIDLPTVEQIMDVLSQKAFAKFDKKFETLSENEDVNFKKFTESFMDKSKEEILQATFSYIFEENFKRYKNAKSIDAASNDKGGRKTSAAQVGYERFFINVGSNQGMQTGALIKLVSKGADIKGAEIGKINIRDGFSFFEVPDQYTQKVLELSKKTWQNLSLNLEVAKADRSRGGGRGRRNGNRNGNRSRSRNSNGSRSRSRNFNR
ncbi:MAG: DEAD/DEAH box helicase [Bacteriovoracaceae bacterium]|jgi:ATP-dependent RNA helicase DeaD|nr:DEAD/DEAH box helicase [Bacteriovoracaceae bacterium]